MLWIGVAAGHSKKMRFVCRLLPAVFDFYNRSTGLSCARCQPRARSFLFIFAAFDFQRSWR